MTVSVEKFVDEIVPIGELEINNTTYSVYKPQDLTEKNYIIYFLHRAKMLEAYEECKDMGLGKSAYLESKTITPVRAMVAAQLELDSKDLKVRPATLSKIYRSIEAMLDKALDADTEPTSGKPEEETPKKKAKAKSTTTSKS